MASIWSRGKEGVTVTERPSMIRVDGVGRVDFGSEENAEALGWDDFGTDDFEEVMSTPRRAYGCAGGSCAAVRHPGDAGEYIGFDLQPVQ